MRATKMAYYAIIHAVDVHDRVTYVVVKTEKADSRLLRASKSGKLLRKYTSRPLDRFMLYKCVDRGFLDHVNRFLTEEEFKNLMERYISSCYKKDKTLAEEKKQSLRKFIEMPAEKREKWYPAVYFMYGDNYDNWKLCYILERAQATYKYDGGKVRLYLYSRSFAVRYAPLNRVIFLPYDPEQLLLKVVASLDDDAVKAVAEAVKAVEEKKAEDSRVETALGVMNYTLMLREMLK